MREKTERDIINYIVFLRNIGYSVTIGSINFFLLSKSAPMLAIYQKHLCSVCNYLKAAPSTQGKCEYFKSCIDNSNLKEVLFNCCWAGVEEFIFPIVCSDELLCRIHISGYRGTLARSRRRAAVLEKRQGRDFSTRYALLSDNVPTQASLEVFIRPLAYMFEKLYRENRLENFDTDNTTALYIKILKFINEHYMENIQIETIAKTVKYSPSYVRSVFLSKHGTTLMDYVNIVRLTHAAEMLRYSKLSITQIAYECGFCDGNWFSTAFKKHYGVSPRSYRKADSNQALLNTIDG